MFSKRFQVRLHKRLAVALTQRETELNVPTVIAHITYTDVGMRCEKCNSAKCSAIFASRACDDQPGLIIFSGRTIASKSSAGIPSLTASSRSVVPFLCAVFAIFAARS